MAEAKTKATGQSVEDFIAKVDNQVRRQDATTLVAFFEKATGWKAQMWGPTIIGFGRYAYSYASGHQGEICVCGFSPRKGNLVIYSACDGAERDRLLPGLGKYKTGASCIYINKLADVDLGVLDALIRAGVADKKKSWPVSAS